MLYSYILLGVVVWFVILGLFSPNNTINDQRGRYCYEALFASAILYLGYEVIQWLIH